MADDGWEVVNQRSCNIVLGMSGRVVGVRVLRGVVKDEENSGCYWQHLKIDFGVLDPPIWHCS